MWPILFKSGVQLGALPVFGKGSAFAEIDWLPVDLAAEVIGEVLLRKDSTEPENMGETNDVKRYMEFNIVNPRPVAWEDVLEMVQSQLRPASAITTTEKGTVIGLKEVSLAQWVTLLVAAGDEDMSAEELPALKLLPFFERMVSEEGKSEGRRSDLFDTTTTMALSPALQNCPPFTEEWVGRSVEWWRRTGYLKRSGDSKQ